MMCRWEKIAEFKWLPKKQSLELRRNARNLSVIGNKIRLGILYLLYSKKEKLSFSEIAEKMTLSENRSKLAYHMLLLKKENFVDNEVRMDDKKGKSFSFYGLTEKGKKTIDILEQMTEDLEENEKKLDEVFK